MVTLIIENTVVELPPDVRVPLNLQASEAQNIGELLTSFTNSFDIPNTDANRIIFENAGSVASLSTIPYRVLQAKLLLNGRDIFGISRLVVLEFSEQSGWRCSFYAGGSLSSLQGSIRDLDLSSYNFVLNTTNCATRSNTTTGVLVAPVNYGVNNLIGSADIAYIQFEFYLFTLLTEIFKAAVIPVVVKNQTSTLFSRMLIAATNPVKIETEIESFRAERTGTLTLPDTGSSFTIAFQSVVSGNGLGSYNNATGVFTASKAGTFKVKSKLKYTVASGSGVTREIRIVSTNNTFTVQEQPATGTNYLEGSADVIITAPGQTIEIKYFVASSLSTDDVLQPGTDTYFELEADESLKPGNTVDVARSLPDIAQADIFKQVAIMGNLIAYFQYGQITLMGFDRLTVSNAVDVSRKLDISRPITVNFQPSDLGVVTQFLYDNDDYAPTEFFGGAEVTFDNKNLTPFVEWVKLIYAACKDDSFMQQIFSAYVPLWTRVETLGGGTASRSGGGGSITINFSQSHKLVPGDYVFIADTATTYLVLTVVDNDTVTVFYQTGGTLPNFSGSGWSKITYRMENLTPRIVFALEESGTSTIEYRDKGTKTDVTLWKQVLFEGTATEGLTWEKLLKNFFLLWLGSMNDYKFVRCSINLNDNDVYNVDFTAPWFVRYFGSSFYLQRINKYVGDSEPTEVELVALRDFIDQSKIKAL